MKDIKYNQRYNFLSRKLLQGQATPEEMKELSEWDIVMRKMKKQLEIAGMEEGDDELGKRMWNHIDEKCYVNKRRRFYEHTPGWISIAACVAILLVISALWLIPAGEEASFAEEYVTVSTQKNQLYILPDSSKVWMETGSSIRFIKDFRKDRNVWLTGKSTFEVKKTGTPFLVNINQAFVEVKGTVFQVWNQSDAPTEVVLFSGKVDFHTLSGQKIKMLPHQRILYNSVKDNITIEDFKNINWEDGAYRFTDIRLDSLIQTIQTIYHTRIVVSEAVNQKHLFTGVMKHDDSITTIIERICFNMGCQYKEENGVIIICK